jgi:hypothetical protein
MKRFRFVEEDISSVGYRVLLAIYRWLLLPIWILNFLSFDMTAPKGLFPPEPEKYSGPKLKVAIIGGGLAGMSTAVELLDQGHEVSLPRVRGHVI